MIINDTKGLFSIRFDTSRRICYETNNGLWTKEDIERYHSEYVAKISQYLDGKPWAICCDLRKYKTSNISEEMAAHTQWKISKGLKCGAMIVESAIVKMQLNRTTGDAVPKVAFTDEKEADTWLKSQGF